MNAAQEAGFWLAIFLALGCVIAWLLGPFADACLQVERALDTYDTDDGEAP